MLMLIANVLFYINNYSSTPKETVEEIWQHYNETSIAGNVFTRVTFWIASVGLLSEIE